MFLEPGFQSLDGLVNLCLPLWAGDLIHHHAWLDCFSSGSGTFTFVSLEQILLAVPKATFVPVHVKASANPPYVYIGA